jgi:UDP-glucose 4-epimerase
MNIKITGKTGYISSSLNDFMIIKSYNSEKISVRSIKDINLNECDILVHTAAIVHRKNSELEEYKEVNINLTVELAKKAKSFGVKQFVFLSTMAVYDSNETCIDVNSTVNPSSNYGKSKLIAEQEIMLLQSEDFIVSIIRPPMVYGPSCPGNYSTLSNFASLTPLFPYIINKRSMIYIENLNEFIFEIIKNKESGIFHPQDENFTSTSQMVKEISLQKNHYLINSVLLGKIITFFFSKTSLYKKIFGDLYYSKTLSIYRDNNYQKISNLDAIKFTEKK